MTLSAIPWSRPKPRRPEPRRATALAVALALTALGCVSRGDYNTAVSERDALAEKVRRLELSNENLDAERARLVGETEELLDTREGLQRDIERLSEREAELSDSLAETSSRLEAREQEVTRLRGTFEGLVQDLESEVAAGQIEIEQLRGGIRLAVSDEILFATGSARLGAEGSDVLRRVAGQLRDIDQAVEVQGHSDNVPIRGGLSQRYPTNWELAAARASRVVRLLQDEGVDGTRLSAVSFAEFRPVAPNDSPEERALNRRIEIRLLPPERRAVESTAGAEPAAGGEGGAAPAADHAGAGAGP